MPEPGSYLKLELSEFFVGIDDEQYKGVEIIGAATGHLHDCRGVMACHSLASLDSAAAVLCLLSQLPGYNVKSFGAWMHVHARSSAARTGAVNHAHQILWRLDGRDRTDFGHFGAPRVDVPFWARVKRHVLPAAAALRDAAVASAFEAVAMVSISQ